MICAAVERCAGIDVGKTFLAVCVMIGPLDGEAQVQRRRCGTTMTELEALRDWELLPTLPGVKDCSAASILAETGGDMQQFPTAKDLSSWAGVCPGNNRSAGKNKSSRTTGGNPWLRSALTECAWAAAAKKNCFLKDKFWRITSKSGGKKAPAIVAVAHTLLLLAYQVLQTHQPFEDRTAPPLDERQKQRLIQHHIRRLGKLGIPIRRYETVASAQTSASEAKPIRRHRKRSPANP